MTNNKGPIGVFDSGIGGLTVLKEIITTLPYEDTLYLGDTARLPYGTKSEETVVKYSIENTRFLLKYNIKLLVVACNTASAVSLSELRKQFSIPIIGVIEAGARAAYRATKSGKVGIIGTETTVSSSAYTKAIREINADIETFGQSCPLFVPLVEEGWIDDAITLSVTERYLGVLKGKGIDTLVLGCTHYPLLKGIIQKVMGDSVRLIDSAEETANEVKEVLNRLWGTELNSVPDRSDRKDTEVNAPVRRYFVTDVPRRFEEQGSRFLGERIG
ncbi:MAG: glutamate racemase, partial [Nitrospirae bacterium]|nr:glutamate racemase [Nitrospirota bacterium]